MYKKNAVFREGLYFTALAAAAAALISFPQITSAAVASGLKLCGAVILPSLFPFFVCSNLMAELSLTHIPARLFSRVMEPVFHIGGAGSAALALGLLGGYPAGVQAAVRLYQSGALSKREAEHLLCFCNNAGPAFILSVVGGTVFGDLRVGLLLWGIHIFCALFVGFLFRPPAADAAYDAYIPAASEKPPAFAAAFTSSVRQAGSAAIQVCMYVVIFSVLSAFLTQLLPERAPVLLRAILAGMLELSNGVSLLPRGPASLPAAAFLLGFSGLSVAAQAQSLLSVTDLSFRRCLPAKLLHGLLSALCAALLSLLPPVRERILPAAAVSEVASLLSLYLPLWGLSGIICLCSRKLMGRNPPQKRV